MDIVNDLVTRIKNSTSQFEDYIFTTSYLKYIVTKSVTDYINSEIELINNKLKNNTDEELVSKAIKDLEHMLSTIENISNIFRKDDNSVISIDEFGNFVATPAEFHVEPENKSWVDQLPETSELKKDANNEAVDVAKHLDVNAVEDLLLGDKSTIKL